MKIYFTILLFLITVKNHYCQDLKEKKIYEYGTRLSEKGFEKNGKREGRWQFYDINEKLSLEKDYKNGIENGEWISYENGKIVTRGTLLNGKSTGLWTFFYFHSGKIYETGVLIDNKREGFWKRYYESGEIFLAGKYINDKQDGVWKLFYDDGKTKSIWYYKDGRNIGLFQTLDPQGKQIEYGNYNLDGLETGKWRRFIDNYFEEGIFNNGEKTGLWKVTDTKGILVETLFYKVNNETEKKTYYPSGNIKEIYHLTDFKYHGKYKEYYENGILMTKGKYYLNHNIRMWKFYDKSGKLDHKVKHDSKSKAIRAVKRAKRDSMYGYDIDSSTISRKADF
ncbi:toxin-antitoxin system YwqK family antitoxin [Chryseobacterium terrae]|uniref:Antitoxin component YwqK of the YwqJK toxin-antitoxin module n=1 Tax=Chryseobacterium terrae TaxID=3163299 RepID=A0ABW8Y436_9FLAO